MNLIHDPWIPVRRRDAGIVRIAPWQITEANGEEYTELAAPRPDFNGALIQFLIGLLQTACPPKHVGKWREWIKKPPSPEELRKSFDLFAEFFELDGNGPRFMQDLTLKVNKLEPEGVGTLFMETPGGNTLKKNTDHFIKRGQVVKRLCASCSAMALWTLQTNAPAGGQGHRTGLRGGGPFTSVIMASTLWATCWSNVLEENDFLSRGGNAKKKSKADIFPWLEKTRTSERNQKTTPDDVHPLHQFWAMPRRIRIMLEKKSGRCDLCLAIIDLLCESFFTKNHGFNYNGAWGHPLTPYSGKKDEDFLLPYHLHRNIGYHHWLGVVQSHSDNRIIFQPARVVKRFKDAMDGKDGGFRLWVFGYDMDNMKTRCWRESEMPVINAENVLRPRYEHYCEMLVASADEIAKQLKDAVLSALFSKVAIKKMEKSDRKTKVMELTDRFWGMTEQSFYEKLSRVREALEKDRDMLVVLESWRLVLAKVAEKIFDEISQNGSFEVVEPGRVARAWDKLRWDCKGKRIRQILGLPIEPA